MDNGATTTAPKHNERKREGADSQEWPVLPSVLKSGVKCTWYSGYSLRYSAVSSFCWSASHPDAMRVTGPFCPTARAEWKRTMVW